MSCLRQVGYVLCVERECTDGLGQVERSQHASWKAEAGRSCWGGDRMSVVAVSRLLDINTQRNFLRRRFQDDFSNEQMSKIGDFLTRGDGHGSTSQSFSSMQFPDSDGCCQSDPSREAREA
jgi:hypothetical protein